LVWNIGSENEGVGNFKNMMIFLLYSTILLRSIGRGALMKNTMFNKVVIEFRGEILLAIVRMKNLNRILE